MGRVNVSVRDSTGSAAVASCDYDVYDRIAGGYYLSGNANVSADLAAIGGRSVTQYHSFADGSVFPGFGNGYLTGLITAGVHLIFVTEPKYYGAAVGAQAITVEGRSYSVPAPNTVLTWWQQQSQGATSYGYGQFTSGQLDGVLHRALAQLRALPPGRVTVQLGSEADTSHQSGIVEGGTSYTWAQADARAVAAAEYIIDWMRSPPAGIAPAPASVTFQVGQGGWDKASYLRMHPESLASKVGSLHYNVYRRATSETAADRFGRVPGWIAELGPIARSRPLVITEWGTPASIGSQAAWIATVPAALRGINESLPPGRGRICTASYFNSNPGWATLSPKSDGLSALAAAYGAAPFH